MSIFKNLFGDSEPNSNTSKITWRILEHTDQLDMIIQKSWETPVIIFKHSTRCSISRMALKQLESEFDVAGKVIPYFLDLLQYRDISNEITTVFQVVHQSPQIIVIKNGVAIYNASHEDIASEDVKQYL